jgi:TATA element modulatory factor
VLLDSAGDMRAAGDALPTGDQEQFEDALDASPPMAVPGSTRTDSSPESASLPRADSQLDALSDAPPTAPVLDSADRPFPPAVPSEDSPPAQTTHDTDALATKLAAMEQTLLRTVRQRDDFLIQLEALKTDLDTVRAEIGRSFESQLRERDEIIEQLRTEGEQMSKRELQANNQVKKLRQSAQEARELAKTNEARAVESEQRCEALQAQLQEYRTKSLAVEEQQRITARELARAEAERNALTGEVAGLRDAMADRERELDAVRGELAALRVDHAASLAALTVAEERDRAQAEASSREQLVLAERQWRGERESLLEQLDGVRSQLSTSERRAAAREDMLREELTALQARLSSAEQTSDQLSAGVAEATQPLLRQIEGLKRTHAAKASMWEAAEQMLQSRLEEAERAFAEAAAASRASVDQIADVRKRFTDAEAALAEEQRLRRESLAREQNLKERIGQLEARLLQTEQRSATLVSAQEAEMMGLRDALARNRDVTGKLEERLRAAEGDTVRLQEELATQMRRSSVTLPPSTSAGHGSVGVSSASDAPPPPAALGVSAAGASGGPAGDVELRIMRERRLEADAGRVKLAEELVRLSLRLEELEHESARAAALESELRALTDKVGAPWANAFCHPFAFAHAH